MIPLTHVSKISHLLISSFSTIFTLICSMFRLQSKALNENLYRDIFLLGTAVDLVYSLRALQTCGLK